MTVKEFIHELSIEFKLYRFKVIHPSVKTFNEVGEHICVIVVGKYTNMVKCSFNVNMTVGFIYDFKSDVLAFNELVSLTDKLYFLMKRIDDERGCESK